MKTNLNLIEALQIGEESELVAFIGGGGKSSLMFKLASQLQKRVLLTTSTRMFAKQIETAASTLACSTYTYPELPPIDHQSRISIVVGPQQDDKVSGVPLNLPTMKSSMIYWMTATNDN